MGSILAKNSGGNFDPVPEGTYVARCCQMIHIGTIDEEFAGEPRKMNRVYIGWEIPDQKLEDSDRCRIVGKEYTLSMNDKATLRKHLNSWRGKAFTPKEAEEFELTNLMGAPCLLTVIHKTSGKGKVYTDIGGVAKMVKGTTCEDAINEPLCFTYLPFEQDVFDRISDFLKVKVKSSYEYKALGLGEATAPVAEAVVEDDDDSDMPF